MKHSWAILGVLLLLAGCENTGRLEQLNQSFDKGYQQLVPSGRVHGRPVKLSSWDSLLKTYRLQLEETPPRGERSEQLWQNLRHRLVVFEQQIQNHRQQPALYHLGGQARAVLSQTQRPLEDRLHQIHIQLKKAGPYYRAAMRNLEAYTDEAASLGIEKQKAGQRFLKGALLDSLQTADLPALTKQEIQKTANEASEAMRRFGLYLKKDE